MAVTLEQFVQNLTQSGLMSSTDISSFQDSLPPQNRPKDAETLARQLVQSNKLTKYQAQVIYQGKTKGLVFGDYRVLDKLGQGGMGVVLKAEHRRMKRLVAVKMIAGAALKSPDAVKRFYREVEAAAKLMHPNIVAAHDACEHDGVHYLVMEYVEGKDLGAIVKERGSLPISQVVDYMIQAAKGLQYAHKQNIVHRDIKPANLLVDKEGTVKILDMGLARIAGLADQDDKERLTASGQVMGTCDYMAPEQAMDTHHVDARADIYSLGCTLYRLLAGDAMYKGDTLAKILIAHQLSPVPSLRSIRTDVPPQLDAVFQKMVAKKPEDRYQTMAEVIAELETCIGKRAAASTSGIEEATADLSSEDDLAFLKSASPRIMATGVKKKVEKLAEATLSQQVEAAETSKQLGNEERLLGIPRKKKTLVVAIGLGLLGVIGVVGISWFAITIRVRHPDGKQTVVQVPEGSKVTVSKGGDVDVEVTRQDGKTTPSTLQNLSAATDQGRWDYDVLPRTNPQRDQVKGEWKQSGAGLVNTATDKAILRLPLKLEGDYDLRVVFTRDLGTDALWINLPIGSHEASLIFSLRNGDSSGLQPIDGRLADANATRITPGTLINGHKYTLVVSVRVNEQLATVESTLDNSPMVRWQGRESSLTGPPQEYRMRPHLGVAVWQTVQATFHSVQVRVVSGKASWTDMDSSGAEPICGLDAPEPAVAPFDAKKAKEHQQAWAKHLKVPVEQTNSIGMKLVLIPPGEFDMGSTAEEITWVLNQGDDRGEQRGQDKIQDEGPRHRVKISKPFFLGTYAVTQREYEKVIGVNPSTFTQKQMGESAFDPPLDQTARDFRQERIKLMAGKDSSRHPVETVSWEESTEFCRKLSALAPEQSARRVYRLPTEAEWEYGCRAGTTTRFYWGDDVTGVPEMGWFIDNAGGTTHPVGEKKPNPWGLYDMFGNVMQWCSDGHRRDYYRQSSSNDPTGPTASDGRKIQRGCYLFAKPHSFRSSMRTWHEPSNRSYACGFRVVCEIAPKAQPTPATDDAFIKEVAALPAEEQVKRVVAKLKELNPGYDGKEEHSIEDGKVKVLKLVNTTIKDVSPVRALVQLEHLECSGVPGGRSSPLADLTPLRGLPLRLLRCGNSKVADLSPLCEMPLRLLHCGYTAVTDLGPLKSMPLTNLQIPHTPVSDLSPLKGMALTQLWCDGTKVQDLSSLTDMPLRELRCNFAPKRDNEILRSIKTLKTINDLPVAEFWKEVELGKIPPPTTSKDGSATGGPVEEATAIDDAFIREVAALPPEEQVKRVVARLQELNPGYDGQEEHKIQNGQVVELSFRPTKVSEISPVSALRSLRKLSFFGGVTPSGMVADLSPLRGLQLVQLKCGGNPISDFSALNGMPLQVLQCPGTRLSDLSVLKGLPLTELGLANTSVTDLSPLRGMPLTTLWCNFDPKRDTEILRSIKTLEKINWLSVAEFWEQVEAGKIPSPTANMGKKQK